ncbi:MAG: hypothetical protein U5J78_07845 [Parasphingorhabdus sp.]|nr:hypothetical protein [Parasphingorhabdus sp.]
MVHTGQWRFDLGERGGDASVFIGPGDVISIPTQVFRGFTNVGEEIGYLFAVLGEDDPGHVLWAPDVFALAQEHGLVLLESGQLIDTVAGQPVPAGARPMPVTTADQVAALKRVSADEAEGFVWRNDPRPGTYTTAIVGEAGPLDWDHGFAVDRLDIAAGETLELAPIGAAEVVFVHSGTLDMHWPAGTVRLGPGDTITVPTHFDRSYTSDDGCAAYLVRR